MKNINITMEMNRRELTLLEILQQSYVLLREKISWYFGLTVLIFLPVSIISEIFYMMIGDAVDTDSYMIYYGVQAVLSLIAMVYLMASFYILKDQLDHENRYSFWNAFFEGAKCWPGYILTLIACIIPAVLAVFVVMMIGVMISILLVPAITILIIAMVIAQLYIYGIAIAAADQKCTLGNNVKFVNETYKNHVGKSIGIMLLLNLVSMVIMYPCNMILSMITAVIPNDIVVMVIYICIDTVLSILNMYIGIGMILRFMNLKALKSAADIEMLP